MLGWGPTHQTVGPTPWQGVQGEGGEGRQRGHKRMESGQRARGAPLQARERGLQSRERRLG